MFSTIDKSTTYIETKVYDYIEKYGDEHLRRYIEYYEHIPLDHLQIIFSLFHYQINELFKYMNSRIRNGRYTAHESRELIYLIDEIKTIQSNLKGTEYEFEVHPEYRDKLNECENFLQPTEGSMIPTGFKKISIIEAVPIFNLRSLTSVKKAGQGASFPTKQIGHGSYATVHKYKDEHYNRFFAIKRANKNLSKDEYQRFKREFDEMEKLNSPYVIEVYNFNKEKFEYTMEYADVTLDDFINKNNTKIKLGVRINLVRQILRAFNYIHSKDVLHRDISTNNILIKRYEELFVVKVSDFGLVKLMDSTLTNKSTEIKGFLNDPKLEIIGFNNYEIHHETYALTRVVYFVMTGRLTLGSFRSNEFQTFIEKGISDNLDDRYKDVEEMQNAFNKVVQTM